MGELHAGGFVTLKLRQLTRQRLTVIGGLFCLKDHTPLTICGGLPSGTLNPAFSVWPPDANSNNKLRIDSEHRLQ